MSHTATLALGSLGSLENILQIQKKCVKLINIPFTNDNINIQNNIEHNGGLVLPTYYNPKSIQFTNMSDDFCFKSITLKIGTANIITINKDLCKYIYESKYKPFEEEFNIDGNRVINYNLPWKELKLLDIIKLVSLRFHQVSFVLNCDGNYNAEIFGHNIYIDNPERTQMEHTTQTKNFHQICNQSIIQDEQDATISHTLNFNGIINGLFFKNLNFKKVINLKILLNHSDHIIIDKYSIHNSIRKIDENNFYLPFEGNFDFNNLDISKGINFTQIDSIKLQLSLSEPANFSIEAKILNILRIANGLGQLCYDNGNLIFNPQLPMETVNIPTEFTTENKILVGDNLCPVNYEGILEGDQYLNCQVCLKNFKLNIVKQWIESKMKCPLCRQTWTQFKIFVNCE